MRNSIERHGLDINRAFLDASSTAQGALAVVDGQLEGLLESCARVGAALDGARERAGALLRETSALGEQLSAVDEKTRVLSTFSVDYQLADAEIAALERDDPGDAFFSALARVQEIHANCRRLLATRHQRAGLELMDAMATYQENAHERLCRWVQGECGALAEEDGPDDLPDALSRAMLALRARPALFRYCVEEVSRTRHNALFRRFIAALTRGGPGGVPRPIEVHAPDPRRYVGDMLAWLHQAAAGEKELVDALLGDDDAPSAGARGGDANDADGSPAPAPAPASASASEPPLADAREVLDRVLDGVCRPFSVRVEQAIVADPDAATARALANLLGFYASTLAEIAGPRASLTRAIDACRKRAKEAFEEETARVGDKLRKAPPAPPDSLAPAAFVVDAASRAAALLDAERGAFQIPGESEGAEAAAALAAVMGPAIEACEASAELLSSTGAAEGNHNHRGVGALAGPSPRDARWAKEAYLINCFHATVNKLRPFSAAADLVADLEARVRAAASAAARAEADRVLSQAGVAEARELVALYQTRGGAGARGGGGGGNAMAKDPALAVGAVGAALDALADAVGGAEDPVPTFDEVQAPRARADMRAAYAERLIEAYTVVYAAVLDPSNGYGDVKGAIRHGPNALGTLLGG